MPPPPNPHPSGALYGRPSRKASEQATDMINKNEKQ